MHKGAQTTCIKKAYCTTFYDNEITEATKMPIKGEWISNVYMSIQWNTILYFVKMNKLQLQALRQINLKIISERKKDSCKMLFR